MSPQHSILRRAFLQEAAQGCATGLTAAVLASRRAAQDVPPSPNETLGLAFIGLGGRGLHLLRSHGYRPRSELLKAGYKEPPQKPLPNVSVRAICDLDAGRLYAARAACGNSQRMPALYRDYRRVLDDPTVDAVVIATADL